VKSLLSSLLSSLLAHTERGGKGATEHAASRRPTIPIGQLEAAGDRLQLGILSVRCARLDCDASMWRIIIHLHRIVKRRSAGVPYHKHSKQQADKVCSDKRVFVVRGFGRDRVIYDQLARPRGRSLHQVAARRGSMCRVYVTVSRLRYDGLAGSSHRHFKSFIRSRVLGYYDRVGKDGDISVSRTRPRGRAKHNARVLSMNLLENGPIRLKLTVGLETRGRGVAAYTDVWWVSIRTPAALRYFRKKIQELMLELDAVEIIELENTAAKPGPDVMRRAS